MNEQILKQLHDLSFKSRELIELENGGSCFDCFSYVAFAEIKTWTDDGQTAICPHCYVDSILPGKWKPAVIQAMYDHYFDYENAVELKSQ